MSLSSAAVDVYYIDLHMAVKRFLKKLANNLKYFLSIITGNRLSLVFIQVSTKLLIMAGYCLMAKIYYTIDALLLIRNFLI